MLDYLMFAVALVLSAVAFSFAGMAQIAAIAALLFFGALNEMVNILRTPVTDRPYMSVSGLFCLIAGALILLTFFATGFIGKLAAAGALIILALILVAMYVSWIPDSNPEAEEGFGLDDQRSEVGKEVDRILGEKP